MINMRFSLSGIRRSALLLFWLTQLFLVSAGEPVLAQPQQMLPSEKRHTHYEKQLILQEPGAASERFWRKHRSYPYRDKALRLIKEGRDDEALKIYEKYLEADPQHIVMHWHRLVLLSQSTHPDVVINYATDFLRRVPGFGPALMIRAFAHDKLKAFGLAEKDFESALDDQSLLAQDRKKIMGQLYALAYQREDFNRSLQIAQALVRTDPDNVKFRENYAHAHFRLGHLPKSEAQWQKVQTLSEDIATRRRAILSRVAILTQLSQYTAGDDILNDARRQELFLLTDTPPLEYLYYLQLKGTLLEKMGQPRRSRTAFETALAYLTDSQCPLSGDDLADAYHRIGDATFDIKHLELALQAYTASLAVRNDPKVRVKAAESAWQLKQYSRTATLLHPLVLKNKMASAPINSQLASRLCMAYEKQGFYKQTSACFDELIRVNPTDLDLRATAAQTAGRSGQLSRQITMLRGYYDMKPASKTALRIGYLYTQLTLYEHAKQWFRTAYKKNPTFEAGMAYANSLLANSEPWAAQQVIRNLLQKETLTPDQTIDAYGTLGNAYMQLDRFNEAADAWIEALEISSDLIWNIHRVSALRKSGRLKKAEVLFSTIPVSTLATEAKLAWYDEAGELFQRTGRTEESLQALRSAVALASNYERQLRLSMLLLKMERYHEAEDRVDMALVLKPDDAIAQRHKAYVLAAKNDTLGAIEYLEKIKTKHPKDHKTLQSLGLLYMRLDRHEASAGAFREAIDTVEIFRDKGTRAPTVSLKDFKTAQNHIAELNRRFHYALTQSVQVGQNSNRSQGAQRINNAFNQPFGSVEIAYRPPLIGYRTGRINELYASIFWTQDETASSDDDFSSQGRVGLRVKPFDTNNLTLSAESVFSGDNADSNMLLRIGHSFSRMPWQNRHNIPSWLGPNPYINTYIELGKAFLDEAELFGTFDVRLGRSSQMSSHSFLSPFFYVLSNGYKNDETGDAHGQVGIGLAIDHLSGYDHYKGHRRRIEFLVRLGMYVDRYGENAEPSGLVGFRWSFF